MSFKSVIYNMSADYKTGNGVTHSLPILNLTHLGFQIVGFLFFFLNSSTGFLTPLSRVLWRGE